MVNRHPELVQPDFLERPVLCSILVRATCDLDSLINSLFGCLLISFIIIGVVQKNKRELTMQSLKNKNTITNAIQKNSSKTRFKKNYTKCNNCIDGHVSVLLRYTLEHKYLITDVVTLVSELIH